jgi:hypothetical protein
MFGRVAVALTLGVLLQAGCGSVCDRSARAALTVTVIDGPGGPRVCNAVVTARDGTFAETLMPLGDPGGCTYGGAWERAGEYVVEVAVGARMKTATGVRVTDGECHVNGRALTVTLDP